MSEHPDFTVSSGNVFADLGLPDAEELLAKADVVLTIDRIIAARGWSEDEAATRLGIDPLALSALLRGSLDVFSLGQLFRFLNALDYDVTITIGPRVSTEAPAALGVVPPSLGPAPETDLPGATEARAD